MTPLKNHIKDSDERKDYGINWVNHLTGGETITASEWMVEEGGVALVVVTSLFSTPVAVIWVEAGTNGIKYKLVNRVTTNSTPARILERAITLEIQNN